MRAAIIAFSMYSKIPMPMFEWKEKDMKYAMCFFPAVGVFLGALFYLAFFLLERLGTGPALGGAALTAVPLFVTGGIHMDGFLDTCDARASYGDREKKLAILKDTHTGAFAVIFGALYLMLYAAACTELTGDGIILVSIGFILSRSLSGLSTVLFPEARKKGMLADFMKDANKRIVLWTMAAWQFLCGAALIVLGGMTGVLSVFTAAGIFLYYRHVAIREFGGVTGDLAGYFLQLCELGILLAVVTGGLIWR